MIRTTDFFIYLCSIYTLYAFTDVMIIAHFTVAPIKALCSERFEDWKTKFEPLGMTAKELTGDSETDDFYSLRDASLIFTTPVRQLS